MESEKISRQVELEEKRRFWKQHIEGWKSSTQSQAGYCRQHELSYDQFIYWKRKFRRDSKSSFIELKLPPVTLPKMIPPTSSLMVSVSRFQIAVDSGFDPEVLGRLVYTLERL
jgi:hypothetical protein